MDWINAALLALVQGVTEFLPISSSGHLILMPHVMGWKDQGLTFDIAVNTGTLAAVMLYFRHEVARMLRGSLLIFTASGRADPDGRLVLLLAGATIPVGVAGLLLKDWVATVARDPLVIATTSIVFGLLLWWADRAAKHLRGWESIGWRDVAIMGVAQAIALIPGTSRSGITMTAGLAVGLTREDAARFSFLMAIPVGLLVALLDLKDIISGEAGMMDLSLLAFGFVVSAVCALAVIHWLLGWLKRQSMLPFVIYRLALGVGIFVWAAG
ncbi:undecaprenyl-diphosphate phosphatase [Magnetofaba australis]|uniref:Undecaprenyl-diphosphatase n=1 Tax=Magnetofaba australis IT-1 TaxID=1434232 RepID=A0A1Y2K5S4_9PROT|nr:undecaprenyl-diphosphate phosphatase [Magnetofaba australis]OSM04364.1 putative undecaprenyl-diphosphatase [Magnetofaba australis IT-1]